MTKKKKNCGRNKLYTEQKQCMQYAKASCCFGQQPHPPPCLPRLGQSSLKTPHLNIPTHPHIPVHTHKNITKHDYVTKPVSLEMDEALSLQSPVSLTPSLLL